jgi:hypothetical protein
MCVSLVDRRLVFVLVLWTRFARRYHDMTAPNQQVQLFCQNCAIDLF